MKESKDKVREWRTEDEDRELDKSSECENEDGRKRSG